MRMQANCIACQLAQALLLMEKKQVPQNRRLEIIRELNRHFDTYENDMRIGVCYSEFFFKMKELLNDPDPYKEDKRRQNEQVAAALFAVRRCICGEKDKLLAAIKASVAGNVIDLTTDREFDIADQLGKCFGAPIDVDDYAEFRKDLKKAKALLLVADNAGEILLDKLLIEQMHAFRKENGLSSLNVTVSVRSDAVLNDAMMEDAAYAKMEEVAEVVESGSGYLGLLLDKVSERLKRLAHDSDMVLAKGQANFESLIENRELYGKTYLLLMIKCRHIARRVGGPMYGVALVQAGPAKNGGPGG